jgi:hypothetical protein
MLRVIKVSNEQKLFFLRIISYNEFEMNKLNVCIVPIGEDFKGVF